MALSPREMLARTIAGLTQRTGRAFEDWVSLAGAEGPEGHKALTVWLKQEHGLRHNEAQFVAWGVTDPERVSQYERPDELVDTLYGGAMAGLRPLYEALLAAALAAGHDSQPEVCKTYTSVRNRAQFARIVPRTKRLVDLDLVLPADIVAPPRLEAWTTGDMRFTHRYRLSEPGQVDDEVRTLLRQAADHVRGR